MANPPQNARVLSGMRPTGALHLGNYHGALKNWVDLQYQHGYPPTVNSYPECNRVVTRAASRIVGPERAQRPQKTMGAEDFSYFLQARPGE